MTTDVCVVGAGLAGLTTALELSQQGVEVVLLEADSVASGASGRNGGFVAAGFAEDMPAIVRRVGLEQARALYAFSRAGAEYVREQIERLDPRIRMGNGWFSVLRYRDDGGCRGYARFIKEDLGHDVEFWPAEKVRDILRTPRYHSAVYDPEAFHIHPLNYALALADELEHRGGRICETTPAMRIDVLEGGFEISVPSGRVRAQSVVLCTGPGRGLCRKLSRAVLPVATHVVVASPGAEALGESIRTTSAVADTRRAGDYYRLIGEGRLLWGGKITTNPSPPRRLPAIMQKTISEVYPQMASFDVEYAWSGLMSYCRHKMPLVGELEPGIWVASGFGGHGLNTTAMAGCLVAAAIVDGDDRWRCFTPYGPGWVGGPLGRLGVQGGYWWMKTRDFLDERRGSG